MARIQPILVRWPLWSTHFQFPLLLFFFIISHFSTLHISASIPPRLLQLSSDLLSNTSPIQPTLSLMCNIDVYESWCPAGQSCFITLAFFQCLPKNTTGWTIDENLNIAFVNVPSFDFFLPTGSICVPLPIPLSNTTHRDILFLALKQQDAYYRTSTILIADDPTSVLKGVSTCKNPMERCIKGRCGPVLSEGEICQGNDECYNPPREFNSTVPFNSSMFSGTDGYSDPTSDNHRHSVPEEKMGLVCDYENGKLHDPPRCLNYNRVNLRPDVDQHTGPSSEAQMRKLEWIVAFGVLVLIIAVVLLFMCWQKAHKRPLSYRGNINGSGISNNDRVGHEHLAQMRQLPNVSLDPLSDHQNEWSHEDVHAPNSYPQYPKTIRVANSGGEINGAAIETDGRPIQGISSRRGSGSGVSHSSAHSGMYRSGRRLSVAEKMARDWEREHNNEYMNWMSQSRRPGTFHRAEQLAAQGDNGTQNNNGDYMGPTSIEPTRKSIPGEHMQRRFTTPPMLERGSSYSGHEKSRQFQQPAPPPNTPDNRKPETMETLR